MKEGKEGNKDIRDCISISGSRSGLWCRSSLNFSISTLTGKKKIGSRV
jgi:hypothetical protein